MWVERLTGNLGASVHGVDAGDALADETIVELRAALLEHKVLVLRDQYLTYQRQLAFASRLGEPGPAHPVYESPAEQPHLRAFDSQGDARANRWHTDLTFLPRPLAIGFLRSVLVPPVGGDTLWANTASAYLAMPEELRRLRSRSAHAPTTGKY